MSQHFFRDDIRLTHQRTVGAAVCGSGEHGGADTWAALLGGCDATGRKALPLRLHELSEAIANYAGMRWWLGNGAVHRQRVELPRTE